MAASLNASLVLPIPPGPHSVSARTRPRISASSARSRSRPMKLFGSAGRLPGEAGISEVIGRRGARRILSIVTLSGRGAGRDGYPDGLAVPKPAEVHDLHQCPPPRAGTGATGNGDGEAQRGRGPRVDREPGGPARQRR